MCGKQSNRANFGKLVRQWEECWLGVKWGGFPEMLVVVSIGGNTTTSP
jgi:hypothetical protein